MAAAPVFNMQQQAQQMRDWGGTRKLPNGLEVPQVAVPVCKLGSQPVPAYGTQVQLVQHTVPVNYRTVICGIVLAYQGTPTSNPGDMTFAVDVDRQLGQPTTIGYPVKDFGAVQFPLGSLTPGDPWPVEWKFETGEVIRVKATANVNIGTGAPNFFLAALIGWEWPTRRAAV